MIPDGSLIIHKEPWGAERAIVEVEVDHSHIYNNLFSFLYCIE